MRRYLSLMKEEIRREYIIFKRYWMNGASFAFTVYLLFMMVVGMGNALSGGAVTPEAKASALVGLLVWQLSLGCMSVLGWSFFNEAATGTLEHLYLSPMGVTSVFLARSVANFLHQIVIMSMSGLLAVLTAGVRLHLPVAELVVILPLAVAGTYGFGFLLAAMTLTFKRTQQLMNLTQFFFMFFSGAVVPMEQLHWGFRAIGETLPITSGIRALRAITIDGATLADMSGNLIHMSLTSAVWLVAGLAVYTLADRRARLKGSIGQY